MKRSILPIIGAALLLSACGELTGPTYPPKDSDTETDPGEDPDETALRSDADGLPIDRLVRFEGPIRV